MNRKEIYRLFKVSFDDWLEDSATLRAAALTFFIILPLPTLLLIVVAIFSLFFGTDQAIQILIRQITAVAGPSVAGLFEQLVRNTSSPFSSLWTAVVVVGFSLGGAIGAFSVLRDTMDCIWEVWLPKGRPWWMRIRQKIVPFILVSALGIIVIAYTAFETTVSSIIPFSQDSLLGSIVIKIVQFALSFLVSTLLLAIIYKLIPEAKVHWQEVALAATVTGIAFTIANYIFGTYVATFTVTTVSGAAGALLVILLWIFVLNEIVLYGAELSKVYATTMGSHKEIHLPKTAEMFIDPFQEVGGWIEQVSKEDVVSTGQPRIKSNGIAVENEDAQKERETAQKTEENQPSDKAQSVARDEKESNQEEQN